MTGKDLHNIVYEYETKYQEGFTEEEQKDLLKRFPSINVDKYYNTLNGATCVIINDETITYCCDVLTALSGVIKRK